MPSTWDAFISTCCLRRVRIEARSDFSAALAKGEFEDKPAIALSGNQNDAPEKTVKTVTKALRSPNTQLKQGVNERRKWKDNSWRILEFEFVSSFEFRVSNFIRYSAAQTTRPLCLCCQRRTPNGPPPYPAASDAGSPAGSVWRI